MQIIGLHKETENVVRRKETSILLIFFTINIVCFYSNCNSLSKLSIH